MVETGVSRGVTSAIALAAMRDLGHGHLYSIDLPPLLVDADEFIGNAVPDELRGRWTLLRGPSRKLLPRLLSELGEIELFLHDADHTYRSQFEEFEVVWPHMVPGGVILCDDVESPSLTDFAEQHGVSPTLIPFPGGYRDVSPVGLLAKPG
jgi:predicted O-methyltransferase YrrM